MNKGFALLAALVMTATVLSPSADAQSKKRTKKPAKKAASVSRASGPETGLVGVKLFDNALRVIGLYGNPDQIQAVSTGVSSAGGGEGGGGGRGGFGGPGGPSGPGGAPGGAPAPASGPTQTNTFPDIYADPAALDLKQGSPDDGPAPGSMRGGPPAGGGQGGGGRFPGSPGGFGPGGPGGGAPGGGGAAESTEYTRWIYNRNGSKFGFVIDKFNRVIQVEALGLQNQRVKTKRGIGFGSSFSQIMKAYSTNPPDGYDINGDTITVRFLTRERVAFRLTRLGNKKIHVVTALVVAAGKQ